MCPVPQYYYYYSADDTKYKHVEIENLVLESPVLNSDTLGLCAGWWVSLSAQMRLFIYYLHKSPSVYIN